jgi:tetratricopeptide (TPR) repeat protein
MRKVLVTFALTMAVLAQGNAQQPPADQNVPANQKVIKDQAEYNAYMAALNLPTGNPQDAAKKGAAMEAFIAQYPSSVVKTDALDQAMAAYQAAGNQTKVLEIANKILEINPNNVRTLAIVTAMERASATPDKAPKIRADGEKGLKALETWTPPEGMKPDEFQTMKNQMTAIFAGAAGFGALQAKDYAAAEGYYQRSIAIDPTNLQDVYQMGVAALEMNPIDKKGFWYIAKAYSLAPAGQAKTQIAAYGKFKYKKYHGSYDGWDQYSQPVGPTCGHCHFTGSQPAGSSLQRGEGKRSLNALFQRLGVHPPVSRFWSGLQQGSRRKSLAGDPKQAKGL